MNLGVDIGGTFVKFTDGSRSWKEETPKTVEELLQLISGVVLCEKACRVGIAVAGLVDVREGVVTDSPNLKFLKNVPLKEEIKRRTGATVFVVNDATAAAYGEYRLGLGKGNSVFICLTLGTGLGGGAVIDGKPLLGASGSAMEVGHMVVERNGWLCHCGRRGCLEAYVSSYGLERFYHMETGESVSSFEVIDRAKEGEESAVRAISGMASYFSLGLMNLLHIFNPDLVSLSGGIPTHYPELIDVVEGKVKEISFSQPARDFSLKLARLGEFSGALGALLLSECL